MLGTGYGECKLKPNALKDYRKRGGVIIDEKILLDAPFDIKEAADELGFSDALDKIRYVFISHSHPGHFSREAIEMLAKKKKIAVFASREVLIQLPESPNIEGFEIEAFTQIAIGPYTVGILPSNHRTENISEECFNFVFAGDKTLLYALDGGWINERAFNVLKALRLDAIIAEVALETEDASERNLYHNDISTLSRIKKIYEGIGIVSEKTKFILSHIPTSKKRSIHEELLPLAKEYGMTLAYDGYFARI